jgi:hypothetical protein
MNMSLNSLIKFMVGIKYFGALHLWCHITDELQQIPAYRQAGQAALPHPRAQVIFDSSSDQMILYK